MLESVHVWRKSFTVQVSDVIVLENNEPDEKNEYSGIETLSQNLFST